MRLLRMVLALAIVLSAPLRAEGQVRSAALARIKLLNQKAMDEYDGLEFDSAKTILLEAVSVAQGASIKRGSALVSTFLNLGVVLGAGINDRINAIRYFTQALRLSPGATLDPARSTPILEEMFKTARESVGDTPAPGRPTLRHTPIDDAVAGRPVRVRAKLIGETAGAQLFLSYRSGAASYQRVLMEEDRPGLYAGIIPGDAVRGMALHYYLELLDEEGKRQEGKGTADNPQIISVRPGRTGRTGEDPPRRRLKRKVVSISLMLGAGVGVVYGGQSERGDWPQSDGGTSFIDIKTGGALAPLHLAPEIAFHLGERWQVAALARIQVVNATTVRGSVSVLGLARLKRFFGSGPLRSYVSFGAGGGQIRHRIPLGDYDDGLNATFDPATGQSNDTTPNNYVDARVAGLGAVTAGYGIHYMFIPSVGLAADATGLLLIPDFAAHLDLNFGLVLAF